MKTAILYVRVSTDEQAKNGYSLRYQEARLMDYCKLKGIRVLNIYREDYSAKTFNRPEFKKLFEYLKSNKGKVDYLMFVKWDRFSRNETEAKLMIRELQKISVEPYCVEQPVDFSIPENKFVFSFYLVSPEVENDRRALNTMAGMRRAQKEGRWVASAPKGYSYDRSGNKPLLVPNKDAKFILQACEEVLKGVLPINEIRKILNRAGFRCSQSQFYNIIRNPVYMGKIHIKRWKEEAEEIVDGVHEPIISERLFNEVQEILDGKRKPLIRRSNNDHNLALRGHLICPNCGKSLTGSASTNRFKTKYFYYHCQPGCKTPFKAPRTNNLFTNVLESFNVPEEVQELYLKTIQQLFDKSIKESKNQLAAIKGELESIQDNINKAEDFLIEGSLDPQSFKRVKDRYEFKTNELLGRKVQVEIQPTDWSKYMEFNFSLLSNLPGYYNMADVETKHKIIGSIFPDKLIFDGKTYRTPMINTFVSLFANDSKVFKMEQKQKAVKIDDFSCQVAPPGIEPESKV